MTNLDYLYNPDAAKNSFNKNYFVDKKLGFTVIEHGTILPYKKVIDGKVTKDYWGFGGIIDSNNKFIGSSHVVNGAGSCYTPPPESIQHSSETVVYLGMFHSTWGHAITDNIRRLWFLKSEDFKNQFKNCKLVYLICTKLKVFTLESYQNFWRLLEILEVDVNKLYQITQPTQFDKIILPDESFYGSRQFTTEYREMIDCIRNFTLKNRTPTSSKKIYYFHGARQTGEERLAEYFKTKGYAVIRPENLTLDEQLNLLINCESFAATLGSISLNSVFMRAGQETILIPRGEKGFRSPYQKSLNQVNQVHANFIDSTLTIFGNWYSNIFYIISPQLRRFFGDKWNGYDEDDLKAFLQYVKDSMNRGLAINLDAKEYYALILEEFMAQLKQHEDLIAAYDMPKDWETFQPTFSYQTHIHKKGWIAWQNEEKVSGSTEDELDIQAVRIKFLNHKIYYSVYYNDKEGWSEEVSDGEQAGITGKRKSIYGIRILLDEAGAREFDILYRVHTFDGEWTAWAKNGAELLSNGVQLNALQIKLEPKAAS